MKYLDFNFFFVVHFLPSRIGIRILNPDLMAQLRPVLIWIPIHSIGDLFSYLVISVVEPEPDPQEPQLLAYRNRNRNALRFWNQIWTRLQHKM